jgi:hypothetical protein
MKKTKYLCVDDEPDIPAKIRRLEADGTLAIKLERPIPDWADQIDKIQAGIAAGRSGLLIDFRLDETHSGAAGKPKAGKKVRYTAESLVAELRRRSVEGGDDGSYPIVLWSTARFLEKFYEVNGILATAFDDIWNKSEVTEHRADYVRLLTSFAAGYRTLKSQLAKKKVTMGKLLATEETSVIREFDQYISKCAHGQPYAFQYALFIKHDILDVSGPIIDDDYLRAILGVAELDERTCARLVNALGEPIRYQGIFAASHRRYWRDPLIRRLEAATGATSWLSLPAAERMALLSKVDRRGQFAAAKPIERGYSTDYDCICALSRRPMAKRNAYRFLEARPLPWKEPRYVAGPEYRKRYQTLVKIRPLEADDTERFNLQYSVKR